MPYNFIKKDLFAHPFVLFDEDSDYGGEIGTAVMEMITTFSKQGHSGYSAMFTLHVFDKLARYEPINPLKNPMITGEYHDVSEQNGSMLYQSTRDSAMFSDDGGKSWYHLDKYRTGWQKLIYKMLCAPIIGSVMLFLYRGWSKIYRGKVKFEE